MTIYLEIGLLKSPFLDKQKWEYSIPKPIRDSKAGLKGKFIVINAYVKKKKKKKSQNNKHKELYKKKHRKNKLMPELHLQVHIQLACSCTWASVFKKEKLPR